MITLHPDRLAAKRLRISKALLRHSRKQSGIRKVERVFRRHSQRAPRMHQRVRSRAVAQSPQTFLEFHHPGIGRRRCSYPVRHGPPPSRATCGAVAGRLLLGRERKLPGNRPVFDHPSTLSHLSGIPRPKSTLRPARGSNPQVRAKFMPTSTYKPNSASRSIHIIGNPSQILTPRRVSCRHWAGPFYPEAPNGRPTRRSASLFSPSKALSTITHSMSNATYFLRRRASRSPG